MPVSTRSRSTSLLLAAAVGALAIALDLALGRVGHSSDFVRFVGRFHPLVVHLPIGFLLLVAFAETLSLSPRLRPRVDPVLGLLWPALLVSAVLAFGAGLLLAHDGGYPQKLVTWHRRLTLSAVLGIAACFALWSRVEDARAPRLAYRGLLGASVLLLSVGAHFGGSLSRGEGYLFEFAPAFVRRFAGVAAPASPKPAESAAPAAEPLVYRDVVAPILQKHCVECHGAKKTKGGLKLDSFAALSKGGEHGAELVAGDAARSRIVQRMRLPVADDDHMPPDGKSAPSAAEIALIVWWIDRGATDTLRVRDTLAPDAARALLIHSVTLGAPSAFTPEPAPATDERAPPSAAAASAAPKPSASPASGRLYADVIAPLLADRCGRCHGAQKQKGKLRLDSLAALAQGGKGGPAIVGGSGTRGMLLQRIALPSDDEHHMPPSDEPQLTASQIALLGWWAKAGANAELETGAAPAALVAAGRARKAAAKPAASSTAGTLATLRETPPTANPSSPAASSGAAERASLPAELDLYRDLARPILAARCAGCHGGADPDGELRIDDRAKLLATGAVVPGDTGKSGIVVRMRAAPKKDNHMPPTLAPQPEPAEIDAVALWIAHGARDPEPIASASLPAPIADVAARLRAAAAKPPAATAQAASTGPAQEQTPSAAAHGPPPLAPQHAGCASCNVGVGRPRVPLELGALALGLAALARRTLRSASAT